MPNEDKTSFNYEKILIRLDPDYSLLEKHKKIIDDRFKSAGTEIRIGLKSKLDNADISGINKCLQLSSTILLLGTNSDKIGEELNRVSEKNKKLKIKDIDPSTILTVAYLYHLIKFKEEEYEKEKSKSKQNAVKAIRNRFTKIKWLVGDEWMGELKIE